MLLMEFPADVTELKQSLIYCNFNLKAETLEYNISFNNSQSWFLPALASYRLTVVYKLLLRTTAFIAARFFGDSDGNLDGEWLQFGDPDVGVNSPAATCGGWLRQLSGQTRKCLYVYWDNSYPSD